MYDTLRELHCKFWKELPKPEIERQYDEAFRELMRGLEKLERKLVLRLLDTRDLLAGQLCVRLPACAGTDNRITTIPKRTVRGSSDRSLRNGGE